MYGDLRQSEEWAKFLASQGWKVEEVKNQKLKVKIYIRKLPLIGSVIKIQRPARIPPVETIDGIAQRYRALCVKLEPLPTTNYKLLTEHGFTRDNAPSLATKEVVVDLTPPPKKIAANFPAGGAETRRYIKDAQQDKVKVRCLRGGQTPAFNKELRKFHRLLSETGRRKKFFAPTFAQLKAETDAFGKNAHLFLSYAPPNRPATRPPGQPLAGVLILVHGKTAHYHHAASSEEGRRMHAPYLLVWEIIKKAKGLGLRALNLGGIYDPRYHQQTKRWQKFSVFKKKFGNAEVEFPAPLVKHYCPAIKFLSKLGLNL